MVVTHKMTCNNGVYRCDDVDITVEEWSRALYSIPNNTFKYLMMLFYMPNHECTCNAAGEKYGVHSSSFIAPVTSIAKKAMDIASRFDVVAYDNNADKRYWIVPMQEGYSTKNGFVWKMRDELVEAIRSVLLDKLIVFYKKLHKKEPFGGYAERYKWQLVHDCKGKNPIEIIDLLAKKDNNNLLYNINLSSLQHIKKANPKELSKAINSLFDESKELKERLNKFRADLVTITVGSDTPPGDERTAAAFLTCRDVDRYAFYMHDITYSPYLTYLGILKSKGKNTNYPQFLQTLRLLAQKVSTDNELKEMIEKATDGLEQSDLMTAQTILWCVQNYWNDILGIENMSKENKSKDLSGNKPKGMVSEETKRAVQLLENSGQIILQGAPGCGKTYITTELAVYLCDGSVPSTREQLKKRYKELQSEGRIYFTTFHQSLDYEEFVEGLKPDTDSLNDKDMRFVVKPGIFKRICMAASATTTSNLKEAYSAFAEDLVNGDDIYKINLPNGSVFGVTINSKGNLSLYTGKDFKLNGTLTYENIEKFFYGADLGYWQCYFKGVIDVLTKNYKLTAENKDANKPYVLVIDEINRANVSKVLGELITLLEKSKRLGGDDEFTVTLPYSGEKFGVPDNLYIIGTMNTADRSLGYIDYAVRRRFAFMTLESQSDVIRDYYHNEGELMEKEISLFTSVRDLIKDNLNSDFDLKDIMIGHSYFLAKSGDEYKLNLEYKIRPLLEEYLRDGIIVDNGEMRTAIANIGK